MTLAVRKMNFVKLGSPKNATDAFAKRGIRALVATKVISNPAISINENQSLVAINIINNNPLIIIGWFNQSIKIDTHSPNGLNCY